MPSTTQAMLVTVTEDPLFSAKAKLEWARGQLAMLDSMFLAWLRIESGDQRPLGVRFHLEADTRVVTAYFTADEDLPIEMSLMAGDLVHNARVALDHSVAALKRNLGGNHRKGGFPVYVDPADWDTKVNDGDDDPLKRLPPEAKEMIRTFQPFLASDPEADPLRMLNKLDNRDKHRSLNVAYFYPDDVGGGADLIELRNRRRPATVVSLWQVGQPLTNMTPLARCTFLSPVGNADNARRLLRVPREQEVRCSIGEIKRVGLSFTAILCRVEQVIDAAQQVLDQR
jgi:hypothetical protein